MRSLAVLLSAVLLSSCASLTQRTPPPLVQKLEQSGVDSGALAKIKAGRVLSYADILGLVKAKIPDQAIVPYLKSTKAPYKLTDNQLVGLLNAGAGSELVNYLGKSVGFYEASKRSQTGGDKWDNHPYFNDPGYFGPAPFPYAFPGEWYDPGVFGPWF